MIGQAKGKVCPLLKKPCLEHGCVWFMALQGTHPATGQPVDEFGCAINWLVVTTIEGNKETRQAGAAIESFRNVVSGAQGPVLPGSPLTRPTARLEPRRGTSQA